MDLIGKRIRIIGSQQNGPECLYEALDFVAQGKVKTIVETYLPLGAGTNGLRPSCRGQGPLPRGPYNLTAIGAVKATCQGGYYHEGTPLASF